MTSTGTTTTTAADAAVTPITKARRPSRATRAATQSASKSTTTKSTSAKPSTKSARSSTSTSTSAKSPASDKPARVLDADAAAVRAELLATRTAAATDALAIPEGYVLHWAYPAGHSRLSRTDDAPADAPKWLARCDLHGTTTPAADAKSARALGSRARRLAWCKPCATAAKSSASSKTTTTSKPARATKSAASKSTSESSSTS